MGRVVKPGECISSWEATSRIFSKKFQPIHKEAVRHLERQERAVDKGFELIKFVSE